MKPYKRTLFYLFLAVMAFGATINIMYVFDDELYKTLSVYLKWALAIVALLMIINEIINWNKPEASVDNRVKTIATGRQKMFTVVGSGISLTGVLLFAILDSPFSGSIISCCGLLILYFTLYLSVQK